MSLTGQPLMILGAFRSGTSSLAAVFAQLGVYFGEDRAGVRDKTILHSCYLIDLRIIFLTKLQRLQVCGIHADDPSLQPDIGMYQCIWKGRTRIADHTTVDDREAGKDDTASKMPEAILIMREIIVGIIQVVADIIDVGIP